MKRIVYFLFIVLLSFPAFAQDQRGIVKVKVKQGEENNLEEIINDAIPSYLVGIEDDFKDTVSALNNLNSNYDLIAGQTLKLPKKFFGHSLILQGNGNYFYALEEGKVWRYPPKPKLFYYNIKNNKQGFLAQTKSFYSGIFAFKDAYLQAVKDENPKKNINLLKKGDYIRIPREIKVNDTIYEFDFDKKTFVKKEKIGEYLTTKDQLEETKEKPSSQIALKSGIKAPKDTSNIEVKKSKSADDNGVKELVKPKKELTPPYIHFSKFDEVGNYPEKIHYQTISGSYSFNNSSMEGDFLISKSNRILKVEKDIILTKPDGYNIFYPAAYKEGLNQNSNTLTVRLEKDNITKLTIAKKRPFHIIYVDISNRKMDREAVVSEVKKIIKSDKEAEILAFISNGKLPEIYSDADERFSEMRKLIYELKPEPSNYKEDVDILFDKIDFNRINFFASQLQFHVIIHSKDMGRYDYSFFGTEIPYRFNGNSLLNRKLLKPSGVEKNEEIVEIYKTFVLVYADGQRKDMEVVDPTGIKIKLTGLKK